jgi:hypothetical protein
VGVGAAGIIFLFLAGSVAALIADVYFFGGYFLAGEVGE